MKKSKILELALLAGLPTSQPQRIYNFATYLAQVAKEEREAKVVREKGLSLPDFCNRDFNEEAKEVFKSNPEDILPDEFQIHWNSRRGNETDFQNKMWVQWSKFYQYYTGKDCKKPLKRDWTRCWLQWILK